MKNQHDYYGVKMFLNPYHSIFYKTIGSYRIPLTHSSFMGYHMTFLVGCYPRSLSFFLVLNPYYPDTLDYLGWEFGKNSALKAFSSYRPKLITYNRFCSGFSRKVYK